jgi:hypothetical protein
MYLKTTSGLLISSKHKHSQQRKITHNYFKNVTSKKKWHSPIDFDSVLSIATKENNIFKLWSLLEHNDFACKIAIKIIHAMLVFSNGAIQKKTCTKKFSNKKINLPYFH